MHRTSHTRVWLAGVLGLACVLGQAAPARAQGFISPLIGFDFGGDASCPKITGCEDKRLNYGVSLGVTGNVFGFEEEFAYAHNFFGVAPGLPDSSVLTLMSNVMIVPNVGPVKPYFVTGVGLIKTHVDLTPSSLLTTDHNDFGWDIGGGVIVKVAPHVAVRGDIRYFHSFQELSLLNITVTGEKINFGRGAAAVMFTF